MATPSKKAQGLYRLWTNPLTPTLKTNPKPLSNNQIVGLTPPLLKAVILAFQSSFICGAIQTLKAFVMNAANLL